MKTLSTVAKTGDIFIVPGSPLKGEIGNYKNGKIRLFFYINKYSGFSDFVSTKELNRRIKENKIVIQ